MANMNPQQQSGTANSMQDTSAQLADQAKQKTGEVMQQAQDTAKSTLEQQKGRAAGSVDAVAQALRQTSQSLHEQDQGSFGRIAEQAASRLEQFSDDLQNKSIDEIIDDVQDLARRDPGLFLGGAMVLGLLAARFFKSSGERSQRRQMGSYQYGQYNQYGQYPRSRAYTQQDLSDYRRQTLSDEYTGSYDRGNYGTTGTESGLEDDFSTRSGYTTQNTGSSTSRDYPGASTLSGEEGSEPGSSSHSGSSTWRTDQ